MPSEALTTPALLSQRERRENSKKAWIFPSLPLGERGQGSEGSGGHAAPSIEDGGIGAFPYTFARIGSTTIGTPTHCRRRWMIFDVSLCSRP